MISAEFRPCRAPHCIYKALTCEWGYCDTCCKKLHTPILTGSLNHKPPLSVGFKIVDHSEHRTTTTERTEAPAPGEMTEVDTVDLPITDAVKYYQSF